VLASDVYESGAGVDQLLFGTLIGLSERDVWLTAAAVFAALAAHGAMHRSWLATGFDPGSARALGVRTALADRLLLAAVAVGVVVSLDAVGALLVAVVLVVPAATVRLLARDVRSLQLGTAALAAAEGLTALLIADSLDIGPGPVMAVLGGAVFGLVAAVSR
jgi:manganese/iron transport system permease protein